MIAAALLNSQPMGFYAPAQIVRDARDHGIEVRQPDVNYSGWDTTLEPTGAGRFAVRLGIRQIEGLPQEGGQLIMARRDRPYSNLRALQKRAGLAAADAFRSLRVDRRQAPGSQGVERRARFAPVPVCPRRG